MARSGGLEDLEPDGSGLGEIMKSFVSQSKYSEDYTHNYVLVQEKEFLMNPHEVHRHPLVVYPVQILTEDIREKRL